MKEITVHFTRSGKEIAATLNADNIHDRWENLKKFNPKIAFFLLCLLDKDIYVTSEQKDICSNL